MPVLRRVRFIRKKKPKTFEIAQDRKEDELPEGEVEKQDHFFKEMAEDGDTSCLLMKKGSKEGDFG